MVRLEKKLFEITVWYRFVIAGEQEKEYDIHKVEAEDVQDAVNKASDLYKSLSAIPFAYYHNDEKYAPTNFSKATLFNLTSPLV